MPISNLGSIFDVSLNIKIEKRLSFSIVNEKYEIDEL